MAELNTRLKLGLTTGISKAKGPQGMQPDLEEITLVQEQYDVDIREQFVRDHRPPQHQRIF
jgi:hypothetical protein